MAVAIVALIAAIGGTAIAGDFLTKKKAKKVAKAQIAKRLPITSSELGDIAERQGNLVEVSDGSGGDGNWADNGVSTATCASGEKLIFGGAEWTTDDGDEDEELLFVEQRRVGAAGWEVQGASDNGGMDTFRSLAYCLAP
jgi:hypothetical protein